MHCGLGRGSFCPPVSAQFSYNVMKKTAGAGGPGCPMSPIGFMCNRGTYTITISKGAPSISVAAACFVDRIHFR